MFGSPNTTSGGNALKFYASQRLHISRTGDAKTGQDIRGNTTKVVVVKNKTAPPKKIAEFDIVFGRGIDNLGEIADLSVNDGIIEKSGAWYKYNGNSIAQGKENMVTWLKDNPELKEQFEKQLKENRGLI